MKNYTFTAFLAIHIPQTPQTPQTRTQPSIPGTEQIVY